MKLFIGLVIIIAVVVFFQGAFNAGSGAPKPRSQAYGPSGGAYI